MRVPTVEAALAVTAGYAALAQRGKSDSLASACRALLCGRGSRRPLRQRGRHDRRVQRWVRERQSFAVDGLERGDGAAAGRLCGFLGGAGDRRPGAPADVYKTLSGPLSELDYDGRFRVIGQGSSNASLPCGAEDGVGGFDRERLASRGRQALVLQRDDGREHGGAGDQHGELARAGGARPGQRHLESGRGLAGQFEGDEQDGGVVGHDAGRTCVHR